jgi:hypothetical protein
MYAAARRSWDRARCDPVRPGATISGCGSAEWPPPWTDSVGSGITGAPILANGHLIVGTADGRLIAFRPEG